MRSGVVPEMRDADVTKNGKTLWYLDRVPNETRCFDHTVSAEKMGRLLTDVTCLLYLVSPHVTVVQRV